MTGTSADGNLPGEDELKAPVLLLLEQMNKASTDVNSLGSKISAKQAHHKKLLDHLSNNSDSKFLNAATVEQVRPYFSAQQELENASSSVQAAIREFSAASACHLQAKKKLQSTEDALNRSSARSVMDPEQQNKLSKATENVQQSQVLRDDRENEYINCLRIYKEAQAKADKWRARIGDSTIRRIEPRFKVMQQHQAELGEVSDDIDRLVKELDRAKSVYHDSMEELAHINTAVHELRSKHVEHERQMQMCPELTSFNKIFTDIERKESAEVRMDMSEVEVNLSELELNKSFSLPKEKVVETHVI